MDLSVEENSYKYCPNCKTPLEIKEIDSRKRLYCPACNFIFWNNPKPVVSMLLHKNKKVLLLQRRNEPLKDFWCLPGGFINYDETPEDAIKREVVEETGLSIDPKELIGVYRIDNDLRGIHIDIIYKSRLDETAIKLSEEHSSYKLFDPTQLPEKIAYKHRKAIEDWVNNG